MDSTGTPSRTAATAAAARAAHLIVDGAPHLFRDVLAYPLLGASAEEYVGYHRAHGGHPVLAQARAAVTVRSRYAEDVLAASGAGQYVLAGAGLDTFAHRSPAGPRVFEADHPATQDWKRGLVAGAGLAAPPCLSYVPADLEGGDLVAALEAAGFDRSGPAVVACLGLLMYLGGDALAGLLSAVAALAPGSELVADYMLPAGHRDAAGDAYAEGVGAVAARQGEPWLTLLTPGDAAGLAAAHGLRVAADVALRDAVPAGTWDRAGAPAAPAVLSRLLRLRVP